MYICNELTRILGMGYSSASYRASIPTVRSSNVVEILVSIHTKFCMSNFSHIVLEKTD